MVKMRERDSAKGASRRDVLKLAGASVPAAIATVTLGTGEARATVAGHHKAGLRTTEHTKKYWESVRF